MKRLLIANRSEIACRIMRTAHELGIETVAVYSDPDRHAEHVSMADLSFALGGDSPATSYLAIDKIVEAARVTGADAVHPGYGFLAENAEFARAVTEAGLVFVGPDAEAIERMGDKLRARELAEELDLPLVPSAPLTGKERTDARAANKVGYPLLVKAAAGGGGRGMRLVNDKTALSDAISAARREAASAFGDDRVYFEKYVVAPRHIEVQVFGDGAGNVVHLGERECSVQRRHQKIIEEAPSPFVDEALRERMTEAAMRLAGAIDYRGAGTVEFVVDETGKFYFLEMNTRLQVEHAVTEMTASVDLVRWQIAIARGEPLPEPSPARGHSIECRVYAEDPAAGFVPTAGRVIRVEHPQGPGVRTDSALFDGFDVPLDYDPMLAKVVVWGPDREHAIRRMRRALEEFVILGIDTNIPFLIDVLADELFAAGAFTTTTVEERYTEWSRDGRDGFELAAAAAALIATRTPGAGVRRGGNGARSVRGPWETLGGWRIGGSARRD